MELEIHNSDGKGTGKKAKLSDAVFAIEPNDHAIWLDVKQHLANKRQGTAKTLEKSEVSGSTKKLHRQKGTGGIPQGLHQEPALPGRRARVRSPAARLPLQAEQEGEGPGPPQRPYLQGQGRSDPRCSTPWA